MAVVRIHHEEDKKRAAWREVYEFQDRIKSDVMPPTKLLHQIAERHGCVWSLSGRFFVRILDTRSGRYGR